MEYTITVPKAGDYMLSARVATVNENPHAFRDRSRARKPVALPFTIGMWKESLPVALNLKEGANVLHFWRDQAPQYGVAVKSFTLQPQPSK